MQKADYRDKLQVLKSMTVANQKMIILPDRFRYVRQYFDITETKNIFNSRTEYMVLCSPRRLMWILSLTSIMFDDRRKRLRYQQFFSYIKKAMKRVMLVKMEEGWV